MNVPAYSTSAVRVLAGSSSYDVVIGSGLLATLGARAAALVHGPRCAVVADTNTAALFAPAIKQSLEAAGFQPITIVVPSGENSKSLEQLGSVCNELSAAGLDRSSFLVAVGGGVVGDVAGFAAAIYHRGIPYLQVPTTLLAQVDSSIGGKTAVNTVAGKNLLGAVHPPALVIADVDTLQSLPPRELNQGFAEIIKHAVIADAAVLDVLSALARSNMAELVRRNVEIKSRIVARDEQDRSGERALLNFGHTVGHAIEQAAGYGTLLHGEAVSLGIVAACTVSMQRAGLAREEYQRVVAALGAFRLPTRLSADFPRNRVIAAVRKDKKFERGEVRFVVTPRLGRAYITSDVTFDDIADAVARL
jgi:3-dehydroquinate synthase